MDLNDDNVSGSNLDPSRMHGNNMMEVGFVDGHAETVDRLAPEYFDDKFLHWTPEIYWSVIGGWYKEVFPRKEIFSHV